MAIKCLGVAALFAALMLGTLLFLAKSVDEHLSFAIPSFDKVLEHADEFKRDDYSSLETLALADYEIVVFDSDGNQLYASRPLAAEHADFDFVANMGASEALDDYASDGLFRAILHKYEYQNAQGQKRLLACAVPIESEAALLRTVSGVEQIWLLAIPAILLLAIICGLLIAFIIRKGVRPLDTAIEAYRTSGAMPAGDAEVPTELQDSLEAFSKLASQIADDRQEQQRLIANVSHDLKTPLAVIRGFAQALDDGVVSPEKQEDYIKAIARRSVSATNMIDSVLLYSKIDHPDFSAHCVARDVGVVAWDLVDEKRLEVQETGYSIDCEIDRSSGCGGLYACVDEVLIARLIENIVGNACKHNPRGTHIRIRCARMGEKVELRIADDGIGIPDEVREHVFKPFVREGNLGLSRGGEGLGLSIAYRCAKACGGEICFEEAPEPPFRTEFLITFPACFHPLLTSQ